MCNRCGTLGHIKRNCCVKLRETNANVANESSEFKQPKWEKFFSIVTIDQPENVTYVVH